jgi:phosphoenolpyruvate carboxylase
MAFGKYRSLVTLPQFLTFFHETTPIEQVGALNIGSRPARRKETQDISDLRAIPWVFAWTQSRVNLPSWYGVGTALEMWMAAGDLRERRATLREMYGVWPFFRTILDNVQMGLAKADFAIASLYAGLTDEAICQAIFTDLQDEFDRTVRVVLDISETPQLLDKEPVIQRSIRVRNPYVDPINYIQVALLRRLRTESNPEAANRLRNAILLSVNGIAAGLQNVG